MGQSLSGTANHLTTSFIRERIIALGWRAGTHLENRVCRWLHIGGVCPGPHGVHQQYRVGRYRLDFAWPAIKVGLEADGWHHQSPEGAARDGVRDADLRRQGWLILRVHDADDAELVGQLLRMQTIVRALAGT